jgi:2-C-methyl-D-erythritol 4-phosphate cytidylyltransferase/2-C-methyl-D-erythritol 4-phosphate cytidylyltransferase/2-C-methyl-D-erythritol 2,4-cyclodiphosphate synthase
MNIAVIVGGGKGTRMNEKVNKILLSLADKPLLYHSIKGFNDHPEIDEIILVINKNDINETEEIIKKYDFKKIKKIIEGGEKRQDSVYNGIKAIDNAKDDDVVLIHNAANPFVSEETISKVVKETKDHGAAVAALKAKDTVKEVDEEGFVEKTLDRAKLWQMQTPQAMTYGLAVKAFDSAYEKGFYATDDVSLVEMICRKVKVIETNKENIKITTPEDLLFAERLKTGSRIGIGLDSHRFGGEKPLVLGGVLIPDEEGLEANSDGDVILHSLFNALSQAIGDRSISCYADKMCEEGITDSKEYLKVILKKVEEKGYKINNIGVMSEGKRPRLEQHHDKIKESLSKLLNIKDEQIGLTFTSGEELSAFGKGEGIQVFSVVIVS